MLDRIFKLKKNNTSVKTELIAGATTFMVMAYIIAVNPTILSSTGMDATAVLIATCIATFVGTMLMAFTANLPFVISAGMGLNAFFAYTVCESMGVPWQLALLAVFVEGIIFLIIALTPIRNLIVEGFPASLKLAITVGIGLFIAFIGLQNGGLVVAGSKLVAPVDIKENFHTAGICAIIAIIGVLFTFVLYIKKVPIALLVGVLGTWALGMGAQAIGVYIPDDAAGFHSLYPAFGMTDFTSLGKTFGECFSVNISTVGIANFIIVIFSFLFVDFFDTVGTLIGVSMKAGMLDEKGKLPKMRQAMISNSIAMMSGSVMGCSTTAPFVESAAGVGVGGRTGLTAFTTGFLFLISMFFAPIFTSIPMFATAPPLIVVGFIMFSSVTDIKMGEEDWISAVPAYICILVMPLFYSISEGISLGVISYVVLNLLCGKAKNIKPVMYILACLFLAKYILI
ncbi:MAG: NCS2 family permease [Eubacterium sp.]|nr:NCS2 family permease [Eubacterium sp.]